MTYGKQTLLELTQSVLDKMDSDEVNSIHDTPESLQVAGEIRDSFRAITAGLEDYHRNEFIGLDGVSDSDYLNQLQVPDNVIRIHDLWYDVEGSPSARIHLQYLEPEDFIRQSNANTSGVKVRPIGSTAAGLWIRTDKNPTCYTSFDNRHLFFDSVNTDLESTLHEANTSAWASVSPVFLMEDSFIPPLRVDEFTLLLNEAIDACFVHFKGVSNSKAQMRARRQQVRGQNNRGRSKAIQNANVLTSYGRRPRGR